MKEKIVNLIADHVEGMTAEEIATFIDTTKAGAW